MQLKEIDRNKIAEHKIRLKKHKKAIESDVSNSNMAVVPSAVRLARSPTAGASPRSTSDSELGRGASGASLQLTDQTPSALLSKEVKKKKKTVKDNLTIKKKATKKRIVDKKALKEKQKAVAEKVMDDAREGNINIEKDSLEEEGGPKVVISKEERAERFKRLHAIAQGMMKKWNE